MKLLSWILVLLLAFASLEAEAARLGGGRSVGRQSGNVTQRQAAPQQPAAVPHQQQAAPAQQPAPAPAAAAPRRPWGAMLGGLAAGLGLAWLAHSLGLGAAFGNILLIALVAMLVLAVVAAMRRSRAPANAGGYSYGGAGTTAESPIAPPQYNPYKVGNDASARPWERSSMAFEAPKPESSGGVQIGSALAGSQTWGIPAGFDTEGFLVAAKRNFLTLQDAWDRGDVTTLRSMMTDEMLGEIKSQMAERDRQGGQRTRTEVEMLQANLLGIEETAGDYLASVEFSGMIREDPSAGASSFREVWNMSKPKSGGSGWLVAGVQALQ